MKKTLLILFLVFASQIVQGQTIIDLTYSPDAQAFVDKSGPLLTKDVYPITENKLSLNVVILTDFTTQEKIGYVEYTSQDSGQNTAKIITAVMVGASSETSYYTSSLDYTELDNCIKCLEYARENLLDIKPEGDPTYFFYDTRLGGRIGVKGTSSSASSRWVAFFNADPLERSDFERTFPLGGKAIDKIIDAFKRAQALIEEKTSGSVTAYHEPNEILILSEEE